MSSVQQEVDERTNLTASNKFELLLFRLGTDGNSDRSELFGINVFKVREIVAMDIPKANPEDFQKATQRVYRSPGQYSGIAVQVMP